MRINKLGNINVFLSYKNKITNKKKDKKKVIKNVEPVKTESDCDV